MLDPERADRIPGIKPPTGPLVNLGGVIVWPSRRLFGNTAPEEPPVPGAVDVVADDPADYIDGETQEIVEAYGGLWRTYYTNARDFIENPENIELMEVVNWSSSRGQQAQERSDRRHLSVISRRDLSDLVSIYSTLGQVEGVHNAFNEPTDGVDLAADIDFYKEGIDRIFLRAANTPELSQLRIRLERLQQTSAELYAQIIQLEASMLATLKVECEDNIDGCLGFIDALIDAAGSEAGVERDYLSLAVHDYDFRKEDSMVVGSLEAIKRARTNGALVERFIEAELSVQDGTGGNILTFFKEQMEHLGLEEGFSEFMQAKFRAWPRDLRDKYIAYVEDIYRTKSTGINRAVQLGRKKEWSIPSGNALQESIRAFIERHETIGKHKKRRQKTEPLVIESGIKRNGFESACQIEEPRPILHIKTEVQDGQASSEAVRLKDEPEAVAALVESLVGARIKETDKKYFEDMCRVIGVIATKDPATTHAIRSLRGDASINVDGKRRRLYKVNLARLGGIDIGVRARESRVVIAYVGRALAIYKIFKTHNEYDRFTANL